MHFICDELEEYCIKHTTKESNLLEQIDRDTKAKVLNPRMLSGHLQGRFLAMISKMINPTRILEIGTYTGYSAICLAEGLAEGGKLTTIEKNAELENLIRKNLRQSNVSNKIELIIGNALTIIPELKEEYQLVFIDADKENYSTYFEMVWQKLPSGGFVLADNVLWSGKVIEPTVAGDADTINIKMFNEKVVNNPETECVLLPVRDGLMLIRKR
ncbi:MAG TPA: O-methyltransferase [Bacteroidia bacterium]|jgi:caffeoyl-CoA O-methyltransferase|nr:O-methyltransferase [Bacteroidia bacterium]HMU19571.1 O-methyltransferase [Bacteroidia bacterium]